MCIITILTAPRTTPALHLGFAVSVGFSWALRIGGPPGLTVYCQLLETRVEIPLLSWTLRGLRNVGH